MSYHRTAGNVTLRPPARGTYATNPSGTAFVWPSKSTKEGKMSEVRAPPPVQELDLTEEETTPSSDTSTQLAYERSWQMEPGLQKKLESICRTGKCPRESLGECRKSSEVWKRLSDDELDPLVSGYPDYLCRWDYSKGYPRKTAAGIGAVAAATVMARRLISEPPQRKRDEDMEARMNLLNQIQKRREAKLKELQERREWILLHHPRSLLPPGMINQTPLAQ